MNFIYNIKYNYYKKVINDLIHEKKYEELKLELLKIHSNSPSLFYTLQKDYYFKYREINNTTNLFFNNLIFINSFFQNDIEQIMNFLKFYFKEINFEKILFDTYARKISYVANNLNLNNFLDFDTIVKNSIFLQSVISLDNPQKINVFSNQHVFFSTEDHLNFSDPNLVKCFFLVVDHPHKCYQRLKKKHENKIDIQNIIFNLDKKPILENENQTKIEIFRKDWSTFNSSWIDPNVMSAFKGLIIKKNELDNEAQCLDSYSSIILHLRQCGLEIPIKYDLIDKYIQTLNFQEEDLEELSNNEKKFIQKNVGNIPKELEFEI